MSYWSDWVPASCLPNCWCELPHLDSFVVEPANTWSNVFFFLVAYQVFKTSKLGVKKHLDRFYLKLTAFSFLFLGGASVFFHASLTFWGQVFDLIGMYAVVTNFILLLLGLHKKVTFRIYIGIYVLVNLILGAVIVQLPTFRRELFSVIMATLVISSVVDFVKHSKEKNIKHLMVSISLFLLATAAWMIDYYKIICNETLLVNGHCFWHLFVALSGYYYYKYLCFSTKKC